MVLQFSSTRLHAHILPSTSQLSSHCTPSGYPLEPLCVSHTYVCPQLSHHCGLQSVLGRPTMPQPIDTTTFCIMPTSPTAQVSNSKPRALVHISLQHISVISSDHPYSCHRTKKGCPQKRCMRPLCGSLWCAVWQRVQRCCSPCLHSSPAL